LPGGAATFPAPTALLTKCLNFLTGEGDRNASRNGLSIHS